MARDLFTGKLVRLAAPLPDDNKFFSRWTEDPHYLRMLDADPAQPLSPQGFTDFEQRATDDGTFLFRIRTIQDDTLIGFVALDVNWPNQNGFVALGIGDRQSWGRGYGTDALHLILNYGFNELGLYRIGLNVVANNERAIALYEKAGFVKEGAQREYVYRDGQRYDLVYYGLLRPEWQAAKDSAADGESRPEKA